MKDDDKGCRGDDNDEIALATHVHRLFPTFSGRALYAVLGTFPAVSDAHANCEVVWVGGEEGTTVTVLASRDIKQGEPLTIGVGDGGGTTT